MTHPRLQKKTLQQSNLLRSNLGLQWQIQVSVLQALWRERDTILQALLHNFQYQTFYRGRIVAGIKVLLLTLRLR